MSEVQQYVERLVTQKIETHDFEDGGDGKCTHPIFHTTCGYPMNDIIHGYKALPADWHEDSSLETWFPLTAEELKRVASELSAARETIARLSAPVSEREWADAQTLGPSIYINDAERATQIIAARFTVQQEDGGK